jgi:hypothetical protein
MSIGLVQRWAASYEPDVHVLKPEIRIDQQTLQQSAKRASGQRLATIAILRGWEGSWWKKRATPEKCGNYIS